MEKPYRGEPGFPLAIIDQIRPKVQQKKVFLSTSFHDEHKTARDALKFAISEYILNRKVTQTEYESMQPKYCFDAADMLAGNLLREKSKYGLSIADYSVFDISSKRASVFFELGIAQAINKPWWIVWHFTSSNPLDISFLPSFLKEPEIIDFKLTKNEKVLKREEFCRKVLGRLMELEKGGPFSPDPLKELSGETTLRPASFYFAHSDESYWNPIHKDIRSYLQRKGLTEVSLPDELIGKDEGIEICYCIKSASLCLVDTTGSDCGFYYMLGYAYAQEGNRITINLHPDDENPISMWQGMPDISWNAQRMSQDIIASLQEYISRKSEGKA